MNANEILPGLWVGNYKSAHDTQFLKANNISVIVNCTKDIPFIDEFSFSCYRVPVDDSLLHEDIDKMTTLLPEVLNFLIYTYKKNNRNVLIHCYAGVQRSAIVAVSFICLLKMKEHQYKSKNKIANESISLVIEKRPQAFFGGRHINFQKSLKEYFNLV